ncbi:MAG: hypothetical protein Q8R53_06315 [Nanoarchaeota archaeon]|nr:hypothetical protein [Nanoarchaeota archaeon]
MGILFKTYNRKQQLHLYRELWVIPTKRQLEELLSFFPQQELTKLKLTPVGSSIEVELNGCIITCQDTADLKAKFSYLVDLKEKYQKILPVKKMSPQSKVTSK